VPINLTLEFVRFIVVVVVVVTLKQFVLNIFGDFCGHYYAATKAHSPYFVFIFRLPPSAVSFELFQIKQWFKKIKQRMEYASWFLTKFP
jgi:hypothetical protein